MNKIDIEFKIKVVKRETNDYFTFFSANPLKIKNIEIEEPILRIQISEALTEQRFQVIKPGDVISITDLDEEKVKILGAKNDCVEIKSRAFYDKIDISHGSSGSSSAQDEVLSWINDPNGFFLNIGCQFSHGGYEEISFYNTETCVTISKNEIADYETILNELEKYINKHRQQFQLYNWKKVNSGGILPWWNFDREVKHRNNEGAVIHPAAFGSEERYQRIYDLLVNNLDAAEYVRIDDSNETRNYENGVPAYAWRQKWCGHKRTPYKDSPEWEKVPPSEEITWTIDPQSVAEHNQFVVEEYNRDSGAEIRRTNEFFINFINGSIIR